MKTKNLLLIGGGLLAVYFLTRKKRTATTTTTQTPVVPSIEMVTNTGRPSANITLTKTIEDAPLLPVYNDDSLDMVDFVEGIG
jgi:hypothetical protein